MKINVFIFPTTLNIRKKTEKKKKNMYSIRMDFVHQNKLHVRPKL